MSDELKPCPFCGKEPIRSSFTILKLPGKERFVRPLTKRARRAICTPNSAICVKREDGE